MTVGAALKKIALSLLSDKRVVKTVCMGILCVLLALVLPFLGVASVMDAAASQENLDKAKTQVIDNLSAEDMAQLQNMDDTVQAIAQRMAEEEMPSKTLDAQVLYICWLADKVNVNTVSRFTGCFNAEQTDEQLIARVNAAYETDIRASDYTKILSSVRGIAFDTSDFINPAEKNNYDLVAYAKHAADAHWGYVYGTYGSVLTERLLKAKIQQHPYEVGRYEDYIRQNWMGSRVTDCYGLVKGYMWLNAQTQEIEYGVGAPVENANGAHNSAKEKGPIGSIPEIPGLVVWKPGHAGIYIGEGWVIEARGTKQGVVRTKLSETRWVEWHKVPYITYYDAPPASSETPDNT